MAILSCFSVGRFTADKFILLKTLVEAKANNCQAAIKDSIAKAKNVNMDPRQAFSNDNTSGPKVRVLSDDSPSFKFKIKNK